MALRSVRVAFVAGALVLGSLATAGPVLAASPSQTQCEAAGGTFTNDSGTKTCTFPATAPGKSSPTGASGSQDTTSGQGNLGNKTEQNCTGNPGQCK